MRYLLKIVYPHYKVSLSSKGLWQLIIILMLYLPNTIFAAETNFPPIEGPTQTILETKNEHRIGDMIMQKIHGSDFLIADPIVNEYLNSIALHFTSQPHLRHINLDIFGVNTPEFNAFAFFGGHIAVHSGLILGVANESELVAVLAHETAHITQRHLARIMEANQQMQPITAAEILAAIAVGALGAPDAGIHLATAAMAGHMQSMINFTREHEKEADRVGIQMLSQTKFDPNAMANVFQRMKKNSQYQTTPPEYLLTHPVYQNKIAAEYAYAAALLKNPKQVNAGLARLQSLNTQNPNQWMLELSLAEAEQIAGQLSAALNRTKRLLEIYPANYPIILQHVTLLLQNKQPETAIKLLVAQRQTHLNDPMLHQMLARAYSLSRQQAELHRSQAEWHFTRGEFKEAFKQLDLALEYAQNKKSVANKIHQRKDAMQATIEAQKDLKL